MVVYTEHGFVAPEHLQELDIVRQHTEMLSVFYKVNAALKEIHELHGVDPYCLPSVRTLRADDFGVDRPWQFYIGEDFNEMTYEERLKAYEVACNFLSHKLNSAESIMAYLKSCRMRVINRLCDGIEDSVFCKVLDDGRILIHCESSETIYTFTAPDELIKYIGICKELDVLEVSKEDWIAACKGPLSKNFGCSIVDVLWNCIHEVR